MDRKVNRIKLIKLYSEPKVFEPINFSDGVNIILGEKFDEATTNGRKTIGVGKSLSIEFINFCLLKKYSDSRLQLIPKEILNVTVLIKLDLEIGNNQLTIVRNRKEQDQPVIIKENKETKFESIDDAQQYLSDLIYKNNTLQVVPSFRELLSPLIRDERSEFNNILESFDINKKIPFNLVPHLFFLNIPIELFKKVQDTIKKIDNESKIASNAKRELTENKKKIKDVKAELNALNDEIEKITEAVDNFKSNEAFSTIQNDIIQMEDLLDKLRVRQNSIKYELQKIKSLPEPETIENEEMELIYNKFKEGLGDFIIKSLDETIAFKERIESFQRTLINQKSIDLQNELDEITSNIKKLDNEISHKLKLINQKGVLKDLKSSIKILNQKNVDYSRKQNKFNEYESAEKEKKALNLQKTQELLSLDKAIENNRLILDSFLETILEIHEFIMGNKECSFDIETIDKKRSKKFVNIDLRIYDDGSHSVDRTKVFIYDVALLFNEFTSNHHPLLLIHDNIFDVDKDTLIQSLNLLAKKETEVSNFQYILTLNRDKIEHEEQSELLKLNINEHKVATFTKEKKFLGVNYQEIN